MIFFKWLTCGLTRPHVWGDWLHRYEGRGFYHWQKWVMRGRVCLDCDKYQIRHDEMQRNGLMKEGKPMSGDID